MYSNVLFMCSRGHSRFRRSTCSKACRFPGTSTHAQHSCMVLTSKLGSAEERCSGSFAMERIFCAPVERRNIDNASRPGGVQEFDSGPTGTVPSSAVLHTNTPVARWTEQVACRCSCPLSVCQVLPDRRELHEKKLLVLIFSTVDTARSQEFIFTVEDYDLCNTVQQPLDFRMAVAAPPDLRLSSFCR